jgi:hypothetical protein
MMGAHIVNGRFQSDKYPTCPPGKVPLSVEDPSAQDLLWEYAQRRRSVDAEFADDLETALRAAGFEPRSPLEGEDAERLQEALQRVAQPEEMARRLAEARAFTMRMSEPKGPDQIPSRRWPPDAAAPTRCARCGGGTGNATFCDGCMRALALPVAPVDPAFHAMGERMAEGIKADETPSPAKSARVCARCNGAGVVTLAALGERTITCPACKGVPR